jgi:hypothetical protein
MLVQMTDASHLHAEVVPGAGVVSTGFSAAAQVYTR